MMKPATWVAIGVAVAVALGAAWRLGWLPGAPSKTAASTGAVAPPAPVATGAAPAPIEQAGPASGVVRHPIEPAPRAAAAPPSAPGVAAPRTVLTAMGDLFGEAALRNAFQTDRFVARVVATVDNLGRKHAPAMMWPVNPTPGRFTVEARDGAEFIAAANAERYAPFVRLVDSVPPRQLVALYREFYPQFQQAYEELGYPGRYFNDRLVEVIDHLLAAPEPAGPVRVTPPNLAAPMPPVRPWVMYAAADPAFEALSAGHAVLLRMGPAHARHLKARLAEIRAGVAAGAPAKTSAKN